MRYQLQSAARTHLGLVRENNEDSFYVGERLVLVADGMGGHAAGEIASQITADMLAALDETDIDDDLSSPLIRGIEDATAEIARRIEDDPELEGMGTTLTALLFGNEHIAVANIGDSRAYRYDRDQTELVQVTSDDSFVQLMVDSGEITPDQAQHHPYRNVVLKSVNGKDVAPRITSLSPAVGDRYLLCTDGLSDYVDLSDITAAMSGPHLDDVTVRLVELALEAGAPDNVTVIVVDLIPADD